MIRGDSFTGSSAKTPLATRQQTDGCSSTRYAGHRLEPRKAVALFRRRGWHAHPDEGIRKTFHREASLSPSTALPAW
jgi:hypothetical protein